jgi:hypothetical protein
MALLSEIFRGSDEAIYDCDYRNHQPRVTPIPDSGAVSQAARELITADFRRFGFALFRLEEGGSPDSVMRFSRSVGLGEALRAPNANGPAFAFDGAVKLIPSKLPDGSLAHHQFSGTTAQGLHVDGALQEPAGLIAASILLCQQPAFSGGENRIFNGVAALKAMLAPSPDLVAALLSPAALIRRLEGIHGRVVDGAYVPVAPGELMSRFSIDTTAEWEPGFAEVPGLRQAYDEMLRLDREDPRFSTTISLGRDEGILIWNNKVSHGRQAYREALDPQLHRRMLRCLFQSTL